MKKFLIVLAVLIALVGGGVYAVAHFVSVEKLTEQAKSAFHEKTGRDLTLGAVRFSLLPNIGFRLSDAAVSNPGWAKGTHMLELGAVELRLALQPLFHKQVEVRKFVLNAPVIRLETSKDGKGNWEFPAPRTPPARVESGKEQAGAGLPQDIGFKFSAAEISNGKLFYTDGRTGKEYALDNVDVNIIFPDLKSAFQMDGAFTFRGKRVNFVLYLEKPLDFAQGKPSPGNLQVKSDDVTASLSGTLSTQGYFFRGRAKTDIPALADLLAWAAGGEKKDLPFAKLSFDADTTVSPQQIALKDAVLKLDDIEAGGTASMALGGAKPFIEARLGVSHLDLDRFTAKAGVAVPQAKAAGGKKAAVQEGWDATPMDFSGLRAANADIILQTKGFSLKGAEVGPSGLRIALNDGSLRFSSSEATFFDGKFTSEFQLNAAPAVPTMSFRFGMQGVQAKPVLETFAGFKKLSGTADADIAVQASGNSQKDIVGSLTGDGKVVFRNGALEGIDLVNIAKMIQARLSDMNVGAGKTDFVELGGTFTVAKGVATNNDLRMKGPLVQASGAGSIDLPKKRLDYRVTPVLTASSAVEGAKGIGVPVDIKGPFNHIKIKPDYASVVRRAIENPEDLKATLKGVKDQSKQLKGGLKEFRKELKQDPNAALQNLLGGSLFGAPQQAEPTTAPAPEPAPAPEAVPAQ